MNIYTYKMKEFFIRAFYKDAPRIRFLFILSTEFVNKRVSELTATIAGLPLWTLKIMSRILAASSASGPMKRFSRCSLLSWWCEIKSLMWWIGRLNFNERPPYREACVKTRHVMATVKMVTNKALNDMIDHKLYVQLLQILFKTRYPKCFSKLDIPNVFKTRYPKCFSVDISNRLQISSKYYASKILKLNNFINYQPNNVNLIFHSKLFTFVIFPTLLRNDVSTSWSPDSEHHAEVKINWFFFLFGSSVYVHILTCLKMFE